MTKEIRLSNGMVTLVDDEDYEYLMSFNWHACNQGEGRVYVMRHEPRQKGKSGKTVRMHRELTAAPPGTVVDHINHNTLDNRKRNLRVCSQHGNQANRMKTKGINTSKYKGVSWDQDRSRWKAQIAPNRKNRLIGRFLSEKEAALAYDSAALQCFGQFAKVNFQ